MDPNRVASLKRRSNQRMNIIGKEYPKLGHGANDRLIDHRYTSKHEHAHEQKGSNSASYAVMAHCQL